MTRLLVNFVMLYEITILKDESCTTRALSFPLTSFFLIRVRSSADTISLFYASLRNGQVLDLSPLGMEQLSIHPFARLVLRLKKNESTKRSFYSFSLHLVSQ